jgi:hypothetical protein
MFMYTAYIIYVSVVTLARKSFSMTSQGSGEQKCGGFEVGGGGAGIGFVCNVWLLFYGYPLVSAAGRYVVESKFNYKIYRYMKTYFSLYDFSLQYKSGQSQEGGGCSGSGLEFAIYLCFGLGIRWYRWPADTL